MTIHALKHHVSLALTTSHLILFLPTLLFFFIHVDSKVYTKILILFLAVHFGANDELNSTCLKAYLLGQNDTTFFS